MPDRIRLHELARLNAAQRDTLLERTEDDLSFFLERVDPIIEAVRVEGDEALARFARDYDKAPVTADAIAATPDDFDAAFEALDPELVSVLEYAADNIRRFHQNQMPEGMWMKEIRPGVFAGERVTPIDSVACYSPRGKGSFPSVTLMTVVPAVVAGVPEIVVLTPAGPDGKVDAATLVAARIAGVDKVYKCGGAQAVAAVAYGTRTVPRCRKIVGPGSPWLVAGKRKLAGLIDPGIPAGPSEAIVLADETSNPRVAALDLLIEAEHGADSSAFLVTHSREIAEAAREAIPGCWKEMGEQRVEFSSAVLGGEHGGIVLAPDLEAAYAFINDYAPEHLHVHGKEPFEHLHHIRNAGEILLGENLPNSIANYLLGPNAVLPTSGAAHTVSALGAHDFLKRSSVGYLTPGGYREVAERTRRFAEYEGFDAHANAVSPLRDKAFGR